MKTFGCVGNTIRLRSGHYLDLANPQPCQFDLTDIAGALSKICRFGGQCTMFYSVAEHSYRCAVQGRVDGASIGAQAAILLHDAAEAFIGDIVKPLKIMLPEYSVIEDRMETAIAEKFECSFTKHRYIITEIDRAMLIAERRSLFSADNVEWTGESEVRELGKMEFACWDPYTAERKFMHHAALLGIA